MKQVIFESVAKALVINEKREVLILTIGLYAARPDKSFTPDFPGGMVDPGETSLVAVQREVKEETGIVIDANRFELLYAKTEFLPKKDKSVTKFLYMVKLDETPEVTVSWEHSEYYWSPLDSLLEDIELRSFYDEAVEYTLSNKLIA